MDNFTAQQKAHRCLVSCSWRVHMVGPHRKRQEWTTAVTQLSQSGQGTLSSPATSNSLWRRPAAWYEKGFEKPTIGHVHRGTARGAPRAREK